MKKLMVACAFLILAVSVLQALPDYLERADDLSSTGRNRESFNLLMEKLPAAGTDQERAQICWRLSRDSLLDADDCRYAAESTDPLDPLYTKAESYADQAIAFDPCSPMGYYLKACNIGRRVQARGNYASLPQADTMRKLLVRALRIDPGFSGPWYVLGQLYEQVPGWPLSFGEAAWAVSLGRKAIDAGTAALSNGTERDVSIDYWTQLARHLSKRDWSSARRAQEQENEARKFSAAVDPVERGYYYEGIVDIPPISDRDEARQLCRFAISRLRGVSCRTPSQNNDLENARETLAALGE